MALALYLDDCAFSKDLRDALITAGHTVVVPVEAGIARADDDVHLAYATASGLVLITKNPFDFLALHDEYKATGRNHPGILGIYQDNDPTRDMNNAEIVRAIANLETVAAQTGYSIADDFHSLNDWRY